MTTSQSSVGHHAPWNKGTLTGQKPPLKLSEIWAIRTRLQLTANTRDLAMFNLTIDSKLRACDLIRLRVQDVSVGSQVGMRATVMQQKTHRPVQFEITGRTRECLQTWIRARGLSCGDFLFPSRLRSSPHLSPDNMPGWSIAGCRRSASTPPLMERIQSGELRSL